MITDFSKKPDQILTDLINNENHIGIAYNALVFSTPQILAGDVEHDTTLDVSATFNSGYRDTVTIKYRRVPLSTVLGSHSADFSIDKASSLRDLIPLINARYGVQLTNDDYVNVTFGNMLPGVPALILLRASDASLVFTGSIVLTITVGTPPPLSIPGLFSSPLLDLVDPVILSLDQMYFNPEITPYINPAIPLNQVLLDPVLNMF